MSSLFDNSVGNSVENKVDNHFASNVGAFLAFLLFFACLLFQSDESLSSDTAPRKPALQLANVYYPDIELADYWVSEKLDGVRAYWNGKHLLSKQGHIYHAPDWFTKALPSFALDGELWLARDRFDELSGIVRKQQPIDAEWRKVSYQIFDLPERKAAFDQRLQMLKDYFKQSNPPPWLQLIAQYKLADEQALQQKLQQIVSEKGEGLMLHKGASFYRAGRDDDLLKLKTYQDAEAIVLKHLPGNGKHQGRMGSLLVKAVNHEASGKIFKIGTGFSDEQRENPPPIDALITYKHYGLSSKGVPRFASYLRLRTVN